MVETLVETLGFILSGWKNMRRNYKTEQTFLEDYSNYCVAPDSKWQNMKQGNKLEAFYIVW